MVNRISSFCRGGAVVAPFVLTSWIAGSAPSPLAAASGPGQTGAVVQVSSEPELQNAVAALTSDTTIVLAPGTYKLTASLSIKGTLTNVGITGATNNPNDVVLVGTGMSNSNYGAVPHGVTVAGNVRGITIANLTIRDVFNHAIALEAGTEQPRINNLRLIDAGRQFVKAYPDGQGGGVDEGVFEQSVVEYTHGSRDADTGALHVAGGTRWIIRGNRFQNIKAPAGQLAGPALLLFQGSRDSIVERNTFVNCQQEIALGLEDRTPHDHTGGVVRNNFIVRDFATNGSAAIQVVDSPGTQVLHNTILSNASSTSLIEYRLRDTTGGVVRNNLLDGGISVRQGAKSATTDNYLRAAPGMFADAVTGNLHLVSTATEVMDQASALAEAPGDFDGDGRPSGAGADYGADEFVAAPTQAPAGYQSTPATSTNVQTSTTILSSPTSTSDGLTASGLPSPWQWMDIGAVQKFGSASWSLGTFTVNAAGSDIGGNADQFTFVYQTLDGDGEIVARAASLDRTHPWAKAGVMIRDELSGNAKYASALLTAEKGLFFQYRIAAGASTTQVPAASDKAPQWLRLSRKGHEFTASASADGITWTTLGTEIVYLNRVAYVGLAVTSRSSRVLTTAAFTDVTLTATPNNQHPQVSIVTPTTGSAYNTPCVIEIAAAASDPDGSVSRVEFYAGPSLIGSANRSPYSLAWSNVPPGKHVLKAVGYDDRGAATTSPGVEVTVAENQAPSVSLVSPASGASYAAPAAIALAATAADSDGSIARVDFFAGSTPIGSATSAPYTATWTNVPAGSYTLTAVARDNTGALSTSAPAAITVTAPVNQPPLVALTAPVGGSTFAAGSSISMAATATDGDGTIAKVEFYAGSMPVGSDTTSPYTVTWTGATAGTYTVSAKAWDNMGAATISAGVNVTVEAVTLPSPWQTRDVGNPAVAGSASHNADTFTVAGAGADIGGSTDQFRFVYQPLEGDGAVTACITSLDFIDAWTKAGVMIRQSLDANSPFAFSLLSSGWGAAFHHRTATGQAASQGDPVPGVPPHCLRLVRQGSTFTAYGTMDGAAWTPMGTATIAMSSSVLVGLAVTSHKTTAAAEAVFERVDVGAAPANVPPTVAITAPSTGATFTAPINLIVSASASDSDGTVARVDFYAGTALIGSDSTSPFSATWNSTPLGTHSLTAVAVDNAGASTSSAPVSVTIKSNQAPSVSLTAPVQGATFTAPATITLTANASDSDGTVAAVDFYAGTALVGSDTTSPYSVGWSSVPAGNYTLTAVARDNNGAKTTSAAVSVTVASTTALQYAVFTASTDHDTNVSGYKVEFFVAGADPATATPVKVQNAGKPTPVNGEITVSVATTIESLPAGSYFSTVSAYNSAGSTRSAPSATFVR